jgi:hypothetical protein
VDAGDCNFNEWPAKTLAQQISLLHQKLYRSIHPKEFLRQAWIKEKSLAPNIEAISQHVNKITSWVQTQILSVEKEQQKKIFMKIVEITCECFAMNNYLGVFAFVQSIRSAPIIRLEYLEAKLQKSKFSATWKTLQKMVIEDTNMLEYRDRLLHAEPPVVPFLAIQLKDLVFLEDGNSDYLKKIKKISEKIVNISKMKQLSKQIASMIMYQNDLYKFEKNVAVYRYFKTLKYLSENEIWNLSYSFVPRGRTQK